MVKKAIIFLINIYQSILSPDQGVFRNSGATCRFFPTCSEYTKQAVEKYGATIGLIKGLARVGRCHPFHQGGCDPLL